MVEYLEDNDEVLAKKVEITASRELVVWMAEYRVSFVFTCQKIGKVFFVGIQPDGRLSIFERSFEFCSAICGDDKTIFMSSLYQIWRFENALQRGQLHEGYDRLFIPQVAYTTGMVHIKDLAVDLHGRVIFVNTLFNCLATLSETGNFAPVWKPSFISKIAAGDKCHLSGLALEKGRPRYVTAFAKTDELEGWKAAPAKSGILIDLTKNEVILETLSYPHSPRFYQEKLWLLNSGQGEFGYVDFISHTFCPIFSCDYYLRGLSFVENFAIIGVSNQNPHHISTEDLLQATDEEKPSFSGIKIIDLKSGEEVLFLKLTGIIDEINDVMTLRQVFRPMALGLVTDEVYRIITLAEPQPL
jgi:uncharacterized protein (TIGR03032 family)